MAQQSIEESVDQVTLQVVNNYLVTTAREMGIAMRNTAYSPLFNEGLDFSCAIFDPDGEMIAQAEFCPAQLGAIIYVVEWTIHEIERENFHPGDIVLHNDPFRGGCHLPEYCVIRPVFSEDELIGFVANIGHMTEVGGKVPGGFPGDATEVFQEGIRIPPVKIRDRGHDVETVWNIILANVRTPKVSYGDMMAMIGSLHIGERRMIEAAAKYGVDRLHEITEAMKDYSERRMRAEIAEMPDGVYELERWVADDDGITEEPAKLQLKVTIDGDDMIVDFTGSDRQRKGPVNCTYGVTASGTYNAVMHLTDSSIPSNHGCYRPVRIIAPAGTIVNVEYPGASVGGNSEIQPHIVDAVFGALATALPTRVPAECGGTNSLVSFGGIHPDNGEPFAGLVNEGCGWGGRPEKDGNNTLCQYVGNCACQPVEVLETRYPILHDFFAIAEGSAGAGRNRGGFGSERQFRVECDELRVNGFVERVKIGPYGLFGGEEGGLAGIEIARAGGDFETPRDAVGVPCDGKFSDVLLRRGDRLRSYCAGGAGYGSPLERDLDLIEVDVREGFIAREQAEESYGVVVTADGAVDKEASERRRAELAGRQVG
ncbi:MAG: hydantoinase B/oxoprolinase family protein [Actinomycetia bacterium]|nr:hydantoinase B/oxoprolinase family protein [Actinomycetes bacterium]